MDYEEILLQITEALREHNRQHEKVDHAETVRQIREVVTPKGKWEEMSDGHGHSSYFCSRCGTQEGKIYAFCHNCGARMEEYR